MSTRLAAVHAKADLTSKSFHTVYTPKNGAGGYWKAASNHLFSSFRRAVYIFHNNPHPSLTQPSSALFCLKNFLSDRSVFANQQKQQ